MHNKVLSQSRYTWWLDLTWNMSRNIFVKKIIETSPFSLANLRRHRRKRNSRNLQRQGQKIWINKKTLTLPISSDNTLRTSLTPPPSWASPQTIWHSSSAGSSSGIAVGTKSFSPDNRSFSFLLIVIFYNKGKRITI